MLRMYFCDLATRQVKVTAAKPIDGELSAVLCECAGELRRVLRGYIGTEKANGGRFIFPPVLRTVARKRSRRTVKLRLSGERTRCAACKSRQ
jgi:hypothetical protein